jgi:hypothetical protein
MGNERVSKYNRPDVPVDLDIRSIKTTRFPNSPKRIGPQQVQISLIKQMTLGRKVEKQFQPEGRH